VRFGFDHLAAAGLAAALACAVAPARAFELPDPCSWSLIRSNCEGGKRAWDSDGDDVYLTAHVHHGRSSYTEEKIKTFNERPWGGGIGKRYTDSDDHTHLLFALAFSDSHFKPEYMAGYGWLTHWRPFSDAGPSLGLGFTTFITLRSDYAHYLAPVPGILPLGELAWGRASLLASYVPRLSANGGNGDVLMIFGKVSF
jgi:lipid IVA palmitoyltransferase